MKAKGFFVGFLVLLAFFQTIMGLMAEVQVTDQESVLLAEINRLRGDNGLALVAPNPVLMSAARDWASHCANVKGMAHRKDLVSVQDAGGFSYINENIYMTSSAFDPERVVGAWMKSSGHRKNLMNKRSVVAGVGIAFVPSGGCYVVFNGADTVLPAAAKAPSSTIPGIQVR